MAEESKMGAWLLVDKSAGGLKQVEVLRFIDRATAEAYSFEQLRQSWTAYVLESPLDFVKLNWTNAQLMQLFKTLGGTIVDAWRDPSINRNRVWLQMMDQQKQMEYDQTGEHKQYVEEETTPAEKKSRSVKKVVDNGDDEGNTQTHRDADDPEESEMTETNTTEKTMETQAVEKKAKAKAASAKGKAKGKGKAAAPAKKGKSKAAAPAKKAAGKKVTNGTGRAKAPLFEKLPQNLVPPAEMTCGCYIRSLLMAGKGTEEILQRVGKNFPDSSAKGSDVSWNRAKLRAGGAKLPLPPE